MKRDDIITLVNEAKEIFDQEQNLVEIDYGKVVFIGDTHGDIDATYKILERYLNPDTTLVFLGDYVDRGRYSEENLLTLLRTKIENPGHLYLLMGNHEGRPYMEFYPADFWLNLDHELYEQYAAVLSRLPLAASTSNGIIALHGALPLMDQLGDINSIIPGEDKWKQITWGDWQEDDGYCLDRRFVISRPQFGRNWFEETMSKLGKNVLIRSHQPGANQVIYNGRCLTIFTSSVYSAIVPERTVAIADLSREVRTVDDLVLETI